MGAWGAGAFENDSALDWFSQVVDKPQKVVSALKAVADIEADEALSLDKASAAIAAAEIVAAVSGKGTDRIGDGIHEWLQENPIKAKIADRALAWRAVDRVLQNSELRAHWDKHGPDSEWHVGTRELLRRLER